MIEKKISFDRVRNRNLVCIHECLYHLLFVYVIGLVLRLLDGVVLTPPN